MKPTRTGLLLALVLCAGSAAPPARAAEGDAPKVPTFFRVLVGHPDPATGPSVVVVPGMVSSIAGAGPAIDVLKVMEELKATYRLGSLDIMSSALVMFAGGQTSEIVTVPGGPRIGATMVDFDDKAATLKISLEEGGKLLAEPTIRELRGGRAVVGYEERASGPVRVPVGGTLAGDGAEADLWRGGWTRHRPPEAREEGPADVPGRGEEGEDGGPRAPGLLHRGGRPGQGVRREPPRAHGTHRGGDRGGGAVGVRAST